MNDLCADIGYKSVNHVGEQLCGDHVEIVDQGENSSVIVLADGLGSGVKASILSTLTSKIISTMMAEGLPLEECVDTIAAMEKVKEAKVLAEHYEQEVQEAPENKLVKLQENDIFIAMSDGCPHAGIGVAYNFGWKREDIAEFMASIALAGYTAKTLSTILVDECDKLYGHAPGDDTTACVVKIRKREPMNILFGPPSNRDDCDRMMSLFFSKEGKHIICGGTTSSIAAKFLGKPLIPSLKFERSDIPPTASLEGADLVTEGVITVNKVVEYAKDYVDRNEKYEEWSCSRDGASMICRLLFEEATDINFYVGRAVNPAHQNPDLPINFNIKMNLVEELSKSLKTMGKRIKVSYF